MVEEKKNEALEAEGEYKTAVEEAYDYIENFDILETITNVGNDEVFTPRKTADMMLDSLPEEVWHNPNYKWLNPATKNGIFEREIAIRLDKGLEDVIPDVEQRRKHILQNMIYSIGQTKFTSNVARRTVYYCSQANRQCDGLKASDGHFVNGYAIGNGSWFDEEEGNIKTPNADHEFEDASGRKMPSTVKEQDKKKYKCKYCGITGDSKYNDVNQREKYAYEFIHVNHLVIDRHLCNRFFGGDRKMKFDIIIGNPPYQLSDGGAQASARPIYNLFVNQARELSPKYLCMIIPSRWMAGGKGLDDFRKSMIEDQQIRVLHDFSNEKECFPNNEIPGGVCYFVWQKGTSGPCDIYTHREGAVIKSSRLLKQKNADVFIRDEISANILEKVNKHINSSNFSKIVSPHKPYGLRGDTMRDAAKYGLPEFSNEPYTDGLTVIGLDGSRKRIKKYIPFDYPLPKRELVNGYKIFTARADGAAGQIGKPIPARITGKPFPADEKDICTETFIVIGPFKTKKERDFCLKYMHTKIFRFLVGLRKISQDITQDVFSFVPLFNFDNSEPIIWEENLTNINKQICDYFNLTQQEYQFVEEMIQEMI